MDHDGSWWEFQFPQIPELKLPRPGLALEASQVAHRSRGFQRGTVPHGVWWNTEGWTAGHSCAVGGNGARGGAAQALLGLSGPKSAPEAPEQVSGLSETEWSRWMICGPTRHDQIWSPSPVELGWIRSIVGPHQFKLRFSNIQVAHPLRVDPNWGPREHIFWLVSSKHRLSTNTCWINHYSILVWMNPQVSVSWPMRSHFLGIKHSRWLHHQPI